jgi:serine protease Do
MSGRVPFGAVCWAIAWLALTSGNPAAGRSVPSGAPLPQMLGTAAPAVVLITSKIVRGGLRAGSGFIIDPSGIVVTNAHVIDGASEVQVTLNDGEVLAARVIAASEEFDIAVLKLEMDRPLPVLKWGNSESLQVGEPVFVIGNPFGLGLSVSAGIVSALNRSLTNPTFDNLIQTDASINRGNSGGPMLNDDGEVVGVASTVYTIADGASVGIGFAIPAETVRVLISRMLDPSHPPAGWMGVALQDVTVEMESTIGWRGQRGGIVREVTAGGPAEQAGIQPGDVLVAIGGNRFIDSRSAMRLIVSLPVGTSVPVMGWRNGRESWLEVSVQADRRKSTVLPKGTEEVMPARPDDLGVRLATITAELRERFGLPANQTGVVISGVEPNSPGAEQGLAVGDVVTRAYGLGEPLRTADELRAQLRAASSERRDAIMILVRRPDTEQRWVTLRTR